MSQGQASRRGLPQLGSRPVSRSDSETRRYTSPLTREEFAARFDLWFGRVYAYVSRRVSDRATCERIVGQVLTASVDLFVERNDEVRALFWVKALSDRLIELDIESRSSARTAGS